MFKPYHGQCIDCSPNSKSLIIVKAGRCFLHNELYKESKKSEGRKEKDRIRKELRIKKYQSYKPKPKKVTGERLVFDEIWRERLHFCEVCNEPIVRKNNSVGMFSHILSKGSYPELRLDPENILLKGDGLNGNCNCHRKWEERTAEMRQEEMWKPIFLLQEALKQKVNNPL